MPVMRAPDGASGVPHLLATIDGERTRDFMVGDAPEPVLRVPTAATFAGP
jgi:hypothetical protein